MPNSPRPDNPHRMVRVEDELWTEAAQACAELGTTRSEVMRQALRDVVSKVHKTSASQRRARAANVPQGTA